MRFEIYISRLDLAEDAVCFVQTAGEGTEDTDPLRAGKRRTFLPFVDVDRAHAEFLQARRLEVVVLTVIDG